MTMTMDPAAAPLAFTWEWSRPQHVRMNRALLRETRNTPVRLVFRLVAWTVILVTIGAAAYGFERGDFGLFLDLFPYALFATCWWPLFTWLTLRSQAKAWEKVHRGPLHLRITPDGTESGCQICTGGMKWVAFRRAVETSDYFFLFFTKQCAVFLPKTAIPTPHEMEAVRRTLRERVNGPVSLMDSPAGAGR
jgi:hypothetical protein